MERDRLRLRPDHQHERHPALSERAFPLNAWYAVAWRHEVGKGEILARTLCDAKLALWRTSGGAPVALENACWHRLMPLSHGRLDGDDAGSLWARRLIEGMVGREA